MLLSSLCLATIFVLPYVLSIFQTGNTAVRPLFKIHPKRLRKQFDCATNFWINNLFVLPSNENLLIDCLHDFGYDPESYGFKEEALSNLELVRKLLGNCCNQYGLKTSAEQYSGYQPAERSLVFYPDRGRLGRINEHYSGRGSMVPIWRPASGPSAKNLRGNFKRRLHKSDKSGPKIRLKSERNKFRVPATNEYFWPLFDGRGHAKQPSLSLRSFHNRMNSNRKYLQVDKNKSLPSALPSGIKRPQYEASLLKVPGKGSINKNLSSRRHNESPLSHFTSIVELVESGPFRGFSQIKSVLTNRKSLIPSVNGYIKELISQADDCNTKSLCANAVKNIYNFEKDVGKSQTSPSFSAKPYINQTNFLSNSPITSDLKELSMENFKLGQNRRKAAQNQNIVSLTSMITSLYPAITTKPTTFPNSISKAMKNLNAMDGTNDAGIVESTAASGTQSIVKSTVPAKIDPKHTAKTNGIDCIPVAPTGNQSAKSTSIDSVVPATRTQTTQNRNEILALHQPAKTDYIQTEHTDWRLALHPQVPVNPSFPSEPNNVLSDSKIHSSKSNLQPIFESHKTLKSNKPNQMQVSSINDSTDMQPVLTTFGSQLEDTLNPSLYLPIERPPASTTTELYSSSTLKSATSSSFATRKSTPYLPTFGNLESASASSFEPTSKLHQNRSTTPLTSMAAFLPTSYPNLTTQITESEPTSSQSAALKYSPLSANHFQEHPLHETESDASTTQFQTRVFSTHHFDLDYSTKSTAHDFKPPLQVTYSSKITTPTSTPQYSTSSLNYSNTLADTHPVTPSSLKATIKPHPNTSQSDVLGRPTPNNGSSPVESQTAIAFGASDWNSSSLSADFRSDEIKTLTSVANQLMAKGPTDPDTVIFVTRTIDLIKNAIKNELPPPLLQTYTSYVRQSIQLFPVVEQELKGLFKIMVSGMPSSLTSLELILGSAPLSIFTDDGMVKMLIDLVMNHQYLEDQYGAQKLSDFLNLLIKYLRVDSAKSADIIRYIQASLSSHNLNIELSPTTSVILQILDQMVGQNLLNDTNLIGYTVNALQKELGVSNSSSSSTLAHILLPLAGGQQMILSANSISPEALFKVLKDGMENGVIINRKLVDNLSKSVEDARSRVMATLPSGARVSVRLQDIPLKFRGKIIYGEQILDPELVNIVKGLSTNTKTSNSKTIDFQLDDGRQISISLDKLPSNLRDRMQKNSSGAVNDLQLVQDIRSYASRLVNNDHTFEEESSSASKSSFLVPNLAKIVPEVGIRVINSEILPFPSTQIKYSPLQKPISQLPHAGFKLHNQKVNKFPSAFQSQLSTLNITKPNTSNHKPLENSSDGKFLNQIEASVKLPALF